MHKVFNVDYRFLAADIDESMKKELNFVEETENSHKIKEMFKNNSNVYIPYIYDQYTSKKLIVMEYIDGYKITNMKQIEADNLSKL